MSKRVLFVAGASGAVGRTVIAHASEADLVLRPHYRRPSASGVSPDALVFPLDDRARLVEALRAATTIAQLIGTIRKRFKDGDTYESSDIATTAMLVDAAKEAGTVDHFVLLSSVGAGGAMGAYLKAKAKAESLVSTSGIPYTILRPSAFDGDRHRPPPGFGLITRLPGLGKYAPIRVDDLARAILHIAAVRAPLDAVLEGAPLFAEVAAARSALASAS
jgi:uncharacterized protein YbjT (DUF2867 family)